MKKHPRIPPPPKPDAPIGGLTQHALSEMKDVQSALTERRLEALRLYVPMPKQDEFHRCMASERLVIGGNRCLAGEQEIYDPVARRHRKIAEIDGPFHVWSLNPDGHIELREAEKPFVKAYDDLYEVTLSNGKSFRCTLNHRVVDGAGGWVTIRDAWQSGVPLYTTAFTEYVDLRGAKWSSVADRCWSDSSAGSRRLRTRRAGSGLAQSSRSVTATCCPAARKRRKLRHTGCRTNCSLGRFHAACLCYTTATTLHASTWRTYTSAQTPTTCATFGSVVDKGASGIRGTGLPNTLWRSFVSFCRGIRPGVAAKGGSACSWPAGSECDAPLLRTPQAGETGATYREQRADQDEFAATHPSRFAVSVVGATVVNVRFLRRGAVWDTHVPETNNYIMAGLAHANSGKSAATFVEDARAATGQDPFGKYPKEGGNLVLIGKGWTHVGMVIYPMLFKSGAFRIIRDLETGQWRAFNPSTDEARKKESKPAPPLIPPRMVKDMSWVQKNAGYLNKAELTNGWTIYCFSSEGEPPQGFQADLVHIDEDINNEAWVGEMLARLADRKGRFVWSAMPHSENDALLGLCERADRAEADGVENPIIKKFTLRFLDNAHIDKEEQRKNIERWSSIGQDELRMRAEGEFTTESTLMYPTFNASVHMMPRSELPAGQVPDDWTRYVGIDPGHAVMATLFCAVPPDGKFLLIYDELYIRNCNALIWGEQFFAKAQFQSIYAPIMDMHGGTLRDLGSGRLPHELYSEQLKKRNYRFLLTGYGFIPGSDDIPARTALVRQMLHIQGDGTTRLKILEGACPNLVRELKRYRKKTTTVNGVTYVTDAPQTRGEVHACQVLEYLCAHEPKYHAPPKTYGPNPWWVKWLEERKRRNRESEDPHVLLAPTGRLSK